MSLCLHPFFWPHFCEGGHCIVSIFKPNLEKFILRKNVINSVVCRFHLFIFFLHISYSIYELHKVVKAFSQSWKPFLPDLLFQTRKYSLFNKLTVYICLRDRGCFLKTTCHKTCSDAVDILRHLVQQYAALMDGSRAYSN